MTHLKPPAAAAAELDLLALMIAAPGAVDLREYPDRDVLRNCAAQDWIRRAEGRAGYVVTRRGRSVAKRSPPTVAEAPITAVGEPAGTPEPSRPAGGSASVERAFALIERAALAGDRCPLNDQLPGGNDSMRRLARGGRIRVEVGNLNWRVVTVLVGPAAGKATARPGGKWNPYLVSDQAGRHYVKRVVPRRGLDRPPAAITPTPALPRERGRVREAAAPRGSDDPVPEYLARLEQLVGDGATFEAIAVELGITKNAAIGQANRRGFTRRADAVLNDRQVMRSAAEVTAKAKGEARVKARVKAREEAWAGFTRPGRCAWPHGHPGEEGFRFCGGPVATAGASYCPAHMARAYVPAGRRAAELESLEAAAGD